MSVTEHPLNRGWCPGDVHERLPSSPERGSAAPAATPARLARARALVARARALLARITREPRTGRARWWAQLAVVAWLVWIYDMVTDLAPVREQAAIGNGLGLLHVERLLHLDPELALNQWLGAHHMLALLASDYYDNAHFAVTLGLLAWLWWRRADLYPSLRNTLVLINVIGFAIFWRYPVAPPRLLVGTGFTDIVADTHAFGSFHTGSLAADANQFAAMPSLHMAWAAWSGLAMWRMWRGRVGSVLAFGYPLLTALAVMATGNHYLADVAAGILTMGLAAAVVLALGRGRRRPSSGEKSAPLGTAARARLGELPLRPAAQSASSSPAPSAAK